MNPTSNFSSTNPTYTTSNPNTTYSSSTHPVTAGSHTAATNANASTVHSAAQGVKGVFAGIHGAGEAVRGTFNSAVDELAGDSRGKAKNDNVTIGGVNEMETGNFTLGTKNREGAIPGDHEKRY